jgi:hypothetical protein
MRILSFFILFSISLISFGQDVLVWEGRGDSFSEQVLNINQGYLLPGWENMWSDAIFTIRENSIYQGFSSSFFDLKYTVREGQLYLGDSQFRGDILFTLKNGQIFATPLREGSYSKEADCQRSTYYTP